MSKESFLPKGYNAPASETSYMKFEDGDNKFRILTAPVVGWEGWKDQKPFRRKAEAPDYEVNIEEDEVDPNKFTGEPDIRHFWAFVVYDYAKKKVALLEITSKKVMKILENLSADADWGDPRGYDVTVVKSEKGGQTSYDVKPAPPKKMSEEVSDAFDASELDAENIFQTENEEEANREFAGKPAKKGKKSDF